MADVFTPHDYHGNPITNVDLTQIDPDFLHPDVLEVDDVVAGSGIVVTDNLDGTITIDSNAGVIDALTDVDTSTTPPADGEVLTWDAALGQWVPEAAEAVGAYRETLTVDDPALPITVTHGLDAAVVAVTILLTGSPGVQVYPAIRFIDTNTVEISMQGGQPGTYEVLVLSEGGSGAGTTLPPLALNDLTDVDTATRVPAIGDLLKFDGTSWVPTATPTASSVNAFLTLINGFSGTAMVRYNDSTVTVSGSVWSPNQLAGDTSNVFARLPDGITAHTVLQVTAVSEEGKVPGVVCRVICKDNELSVYTFHGVAVKPNSNTRFVITWAR